MENPKVSPLAAGQIKAIRDPNNLAARYASIVERIAGLVDGAEDTRRALVVTITNERRKKIHLATQLMLSANGLIGDLSGTDPEEATEMQARLQKLIIDLTSLESA